MRVCVYTVHIRYTSFSDPSVPALHLPQFTASMMLVTRTSCPSPRAIKKNKMILEGCRLGRLATAAGENIKVFSQSRTESQLYCAAEALKHSDKIKNHMNCPGFGAFIKPIVILASVTQISLSGVVLIFSTGPPTNFTLDIGKI